MSLLQDVCILATTDGNIAHSSISKKTLAAGKHTRVDWDVQDGIWQHMGRQAESTQEIALQSA